MPIRISTDRPGQGETGHAHLSNTRQLPSMGRSVIPRYSAAQKKSPKIVPKNHHFSCDHEQNADFAFRTVKGVRRVMRRAFSYARTRNRTMACDTYPLSSPIFARVSRTNEATSARAVRASCGLWKCDKICREHLFVRGEVISGFSRRTRRGKVPTSTAPTPRTFKATLSFVRANHDAHHIAHVSQGAASIKILVLQLRDRKWPSRRYRNKRFTIPRRGACSTRRAMREVAQLRAAREDT